MPLFRLLKRKDDGQGDTDHHQINTQVEEHRRAKISTWPRPGRLRYPHSAGEERIARQACDHAADQGCQQSCTDHDMGFYVQHPARFCSSESNGIERKGAAATSPPAKPPPGWLCPRRNRKTEKISKQRRQIACCRLQDQRGHLLRSSLSFLPRSQFQQYAYTPIAAIPSTVISPIVSIPRKSTRITLTMLRPCARGRAFSTK
jgi:hypothetical protein